MGLRIAIILAVVPLTTACTTVDFSSMANNPSSFSRDSIQKNVVERAVGRLFAAFSKNGWSERDAQSRMEAAASVLLKGMSATKRSETASGVAYAATVLDLSTLKSDIQSATGYVTQTTKAAEVFHAMATNDSNLRTELERLETALVVSNEAQENFQRAGERLSLDETRTYWVEFTASVEALRTVTNSFGDSVRAPVNLSATAPAS